jgi:hypothetical protein
VEVKELKEKIIEFKKSMLLDKNGIKEFNEILSMIADLQKKFEGMK